MAVTSEGLLRALVIGDEQLVLEGLEALLRAMLPELSLDKTADVAAALQLAGSVRYEVILLDRRPVDSSGAHIDGREIVRVVAQLRLDHARGGGVRDRQHAGRCDSRCDARRPLPTRADAQPARPAVLPSCRPAGRVRADR
jgi:hypothetical protein